MEQRPEVEILIHIGAPSRAADDAHYRALATSYINFEPADRLDIPNHVSSSMSTNEGRHELHNQESQHDTIQELPTSSLSSEPFGSFRSPQASFRSVLDNAGSPRIVPRPKPEEPEQSNNPEDAMPMSQSSWQTPSSVVQDSYPENFINITSLTSPTRVLEHYLQNFDYSSASQDPPSQSQQSNTGTPSQGLARPACRERILASLAPSTPQIVPCTPPVNHSPNSRGLAGENRIEGHQEGVMQQGSQNEITSDNIIEETILIDSSDPSSIPRADSEPPPAKRHRLDSANTGPGALPRAASDIGPRASANQMPILTVAFLEEHGYTYDSLELRAPEPPVSCRNIEPADLITSRLGELARDLDIPKRYKPRTEKREVRPFERGFWLIDCSSWDAQLKPHVWAYLANYVGSGFAGWGVWCKRDPDFQWIRVYCWGCIVAHIYLLLYLASQRKVLFTGASWNDGEGIPIIIMETRSPGVN
ncbi:uncharacterized protein F4822DRAFT_419587 [Hypoxylon trugodes]|uniref:uncharacterized protein n=1 Tax=Hypoxylon trugodes TaxID=326681 RepID=UPI00218D79DF|nr:uncharacterized protein F4822DRAFT_419587 [Hypoxylon trugodes]KAI1383192.1 hypothetical protein F4822DRAFT_419587 [Hypoxylon trugodes]